MSRTPQHLSLAALSLALWGGATITHGCWLKPIDSWSPRVVTDRDVPDGDRPGTVDGACGSDAQTACDAGLCRDGSCERPVGGAANASATCIWTDVGRVWCWGTGGFFTYEDVDDLPRPTALDTLRQPVIEVALAAYYSACALTRTGELFCWRNEAPPSRTPKRIASLSSVRHVVAGYFHTCALLDDGHVECMGGNFFGQLGRGDRARDAGTEGEFARVIEEGGAEISNVVDLAAGDGHTCARKRDGTVWCWGEDNLGQLGSGSRSSTRCGTDSYEPCSHSARRVDGLTLTPTDTPEPQSLAAGARHTCARRDNTVWCWGQADSYGFAPSTPAQRDTELCDGTPCSTSPRQVGTTEVPDARRLIAGDAYTCALRGDAAHSIVCWGYAYNRYETLEGIVGAPATLVRGVRHACAISDTGAVMCWGDASEGAIAAADNVRTMATQVGGVSGATAIAAGERHTCATAGDGGVLCWGQNAYHQLGDGTMTDRGRPVAVRNVSGVTQMSAGAAHTCARRADGTLVCWGLNDYDQAGRVDPNVVQEAPSDGGITTDRPLTGVRHVAAGGQSTCVIRDGDRRVECWGRNDSCQISAPSDGGCAPTTQPVRQVVMLPGTLAAGLGVGQEHGCANGSLDGGVGGSIVCWGHNGWGRADPSAVSWDRVPPTLLTFASGATEVSGGASHSCAVLDRGAVYCWGDDRHGALARPPLDNFSPGLAVETGAVAVRAGDQYTCARMSDRTVRCWGNGAWGQLGNGALADQLAPVRVLIADARPLDQVVDLAVGAHHACALRGDGTVWCWGSDLCGQLGQGNVCRRSRAALIAW